MEVRWLKEVRGHKPGDVTDEDEPRAKFAIACGLAEAVEEEAEESDDD